MKKRLFVILDAGHGGVINGEYQTAGKRSPIWSDGTQLFEGVFNRAICSRIAIKLEKLGIDYDIVYNDSDVPLKDRVTLANSLAEYHKKTHDCLLISVHANGGGGTGFECYTYHGQTKSDVFASLLCDEFDHVFPNEKLRVDFSDGDADKEANFYILRKTTMASVLSENFFMDTEKDCKLIMSIEGQALIAGLHVRAIQSFKGYYDYE